VGNAPGDSLAQPPVADGPLSAPHENAAAASAAAPAAGTGGDGQQGGQQNQRDGGVARQEYKRPTARRRVNGGVGPT